MLRYGSSHQNDTIEAGVSTTWNDHRESPLIAPKDSTSDYDSEIIYSDLTSLNSSVLNYKYENGRHYHAFHAGKYVKLLHNATDTTFPG